MNTANRDQNWRATVRAPVARRPTKNSSPEMKLRRDENGKLTVQLSKTSDLVLPYEYEKAKMTEYETLIGYGDNSLSVSPSTVVTPSNVQTQ